jgi:hypothetical protein
MNKTDRRELPTATAAVRDTFPNLADALKRRAGRFRLAVRAPAASNCFTCQISKHLHAALPRSHRVSLRRPSADSGEIPAIILFKVIRATRQNGLKLIVDQETRGRVHSVF